MIWDVRLNKKDNGAKVSEAADKSVGVGPSTSDPDVSETLQETHPISTQTTQEPKQSIFPIVGLGASAGGLEAIEEFFRAMPADSGMAFVVVMHQAAKHVSLLPELLSKCTSMNVTAIQDRMSVQPNHVYIVPPGKNADLFNGRLFLTDLPPKHGAPLPIDYFFSSLADDRNKFAVGIVLSGTGNDGTIGVSAIKGNSGTVMVQRAESAKFSGMPQNAIDTGWADFISAPSEMPGELTRFARGPFCGKSASIETTPQNIQESLPEILLRIRRRCGQDFSGYKPSTICRRIERRMGAHRIDDPKQYLRFLEEHSPEADCLFQELLISVTSFFRDAWTFEALTEKAVVPMLREKAVHDSTIRVWIPGCATGEEAYSIAILLREWMNKLNVNLDVQVFATDLDAVAIEKARSGVFPESIAEDVSNQRLTKFFTKVNGRYQIRKEVRDWLIFAPQNVIYDPPFTKLDLISCRNLMIYLQGDLQKRLLSLFHYSLNAGGCLFLGTSETIGEPNELFVTLDKKAKLYRCIKSTQHLAGESDIPITVAPIVHRPKTDVTKKLPLQPISLAVDELLANSFAPPTVIVERNGKIVHVHGRTGQFLEFAQGEPSRDIVASCREGLRVELASAIRMAPLQDGPVLRENIFVKTNGDTTRVNLVVERIEKPISIRGLLRVSFEVVDDAPYSESANGPVDAESKTVREQELERELEDTRKSLNRSIEELNASTEEMKSSNEELQSTNEELQSTNEELETSKEELQSLNEELQTVNSEYQEKIHDLMQANDDMTNLLNSTNIATIFVDNQLCIKRFTEQAKQISRLIPTDVGRPLQDVTSHLKHEDLVSDASEVLETLVFKEREVRTSDGHWLLMRILPYRTSDDKIDGVVMTFTDIDKLKSFESEIQHARGRAESILATTREPLLVLDHQACVHTANDAFYKMFKILPNETIGRLIYDVCDQRWDTPSMHQLLEEILPNEIQVQDFEFEHDFPKIGPKRLLLNARRIEGESEDSALILLAIEEMTKL